MEGAVLINLATSIHIALTSIAPEEFVLPPVHLADLKSLVSVVKAFLLDLDGGRRYTESGGLKIKDWLQELGDILCDMDNLVDELATEALRRKVISRNTLAKEVRLFFSNPSYRLKMHRLSKLIRKLSDSVAKPGDKLSLSYDRPYSEVNSRPVVTYKPETYSFVIEDYVIGREYEKQTIIRALLDFTENNISVIPIVGIGGIGKTTLAQLVFNDKNVAKHFDLKMWVCVSDHSDLKQVIKKIVESATEVRLEDLWLDSLVKHLQTMIEGKRFLLVLDDVWNEDFSQWIILENVLRSGAKGSKIVITARSNRVASIMGTFQPVDLQPLSQKDSWALFKKMVFGIGEGEEPKDQAFVDIGMDIIKKCNGFPPLIRTIGNQLFSRKSKEGWLEFTDKELPKFLTQENYMYSTSYNCSSSESNQRETFSFVLEGEVIGRENEKDEIMEKLLKYNVNDISVLPIVGNGGIGKTALAQLVFNDKNVSKHFDLKMWVYVSEHFDLKQVIKKIVESATQERPEDLLMDSLVNHLQTMIDGKRFLLVLDDVWNEDLEQWNILKNVLQCGAKGSKIVITARSNGDASIMGTFQPVDLKPLSEEDSWALFKKMVFGIGQGEEPKDQAFVDIGKDIIKKCDGSPLLIRTIGSLLYSRKLKEEDWLKFHDDELPNILQQDDRISSILRLSYDHLPSHLKNCFAYCALFPKDHEINVQSLIKLWMGHGLLQSYSYQSPEDVGYGIFMHLLKKSFFHEVERDTQGIIRSCKMQNLMHELATLVAGGMCTMSNPKGEKVTERTQHVSFNLSLDSSWQIPSHLCRAKRLRTFLLPSQSRLQTEEVFSKASCNSIFSRFKCVRVLDLHDLGIKVVPSSIRKLKHLRYLDLSKNGIKILPSSITRLQNLQTLKLSNCDLLEELPKDIKNLIRLRHLEIDGCDKLTRMPPGLAQLTDLQTLSFFVLRKDQGFVCRHSAKLSELERLSNLRGGLEILHLEQLADATSEAKNAKLEEKHLQLLTLKWYRQDYHDADIENEEKLLEVLQPHNDLEVLWVVGYGGTKFPSWLSSLSHLVKFTLCNCPRFKGLPPLDQLSSLKILKLQRLHALEYVTDRGGNSSSASTEFLTSLTELVLWDCPKLQRWWKHANDASIAVSFPLLSKLEVQYCPQLTSMPQYPWLHEQLVLCNAKMELLQQTMLMSSSVASSSFVPLSNLKSLTLNGIEEIESLQRYLLQNLTSLEQFNVLECPSLRSLSEGILNLASLKYLDIRDCQNLDLCEDEGDSKRWRGLKSLRSLTIWGIPKLESLPNRLEHVTSLENLRILNCPNLTALPSWLSSLTSLSRLVLSKCSKLALLPPEISCLTSLRRLVIDDCPMLLLRCQGKTAEDFHKIKHIAEISERLTSRDFD